MFKKIKEYRKKFLLRNKYCSGERRPFYLLAGKYLPQNQESIVVDIGSGNGEFAKIFNFKFKFKKFFLLDANPENILNLKKEFGERYVLQYKIPNRMPFEDGEISYIHCSHVIEHLFPSDLYAFLVEVDRVLSIRGILVISAPLFWSRFYNDLSHIKPYNPSVLINYLSFNQSKTRTSKTISQSYKLLELIYRYRTENVNDYNYYGNKFFILDLLLYFTKIILIKFGFRKYIKNGYTIIFKKGR